MNHWNPDTTTDRKMLRPAPSVKETGKHFEKLAARHPDQVTIRELGRSVGGLPLCHSFGKNTRDAVPDWTNACYQYLQLEQPSQHRFLCTTVAYS